MRTRVQSSLDKVSDPSFKSVTSSSEECTWTRVQSSLVKVGDPSLSISMDKTVPLDFSCNFTYVPNLQQHLAPPYPVQCVVQQHLAPTLPCTVCGTAAPCPTLPCTVCSRVPSNFTQTTCCSTLTILIKHQDLMTIIVSSRLCKS